MVVSPPVRTMRSGSGRSGAVRWAASASSSIDDGRRRPSRDLGRQRRHRRRPARPDRRGRRPSVSVIPWLRGGHRLGLGDDADRAAAAPRASRRPRPRMRTPRWWSSSRRARTQPLGVDERAAAATSSGSPHQLARQHLDGEPTQPDAQRAVDHVGERRRRRRPAAARSRRDPGTWCRSTSAVTSAQPTPTDYDPSRRSPTTLRSSPDAPGPRALDRDREPGRRARSGPGPSPPRARRARRGRPRRRDRAVGRRRRPRRPGSRRVRARAWPSSRAAATAPSACSRASRPTRAACSASSHSARATTSPASSTSPAAISPPPSTCCAPARCCPPTSGARTPPTARPRGSPPSPTPASTRWRTCGPTTSRGRAARRSTCSPRCARSPRTRPPPCASPSTTP